MGTITFSTEMYLFYMALLDYVIMCRFVYHKLIRGKIADNFRYFIFQANQLYWTKSFQCKYLISMFCKRE